MNDTEKLLTIDEAAQFLRVSKSWIFKLTSSRAIPFIKMGRRVLFDPDELREFARAKRVSTVEEELAAQ